MIFTSTKASWYVVCKLWAKGYFCTMLTSLHFIFGGSPEHEYWVLDWWCLWAKRLVSPKLSFRNKTLKYNRGDEIQIGPIISKALVNFGLVWKLFCELTLFNSIQFYSTFISFKQISPDAALLVKKHLNFSQKLSK